MAFCGKKILLHIIGKKYIYFIYVTFTNKKIYYMNVEELILYR